MGQYHYDIYHYSCDICNNIEVMLLNSEKQHLNRMFLKLS